jgi:hypothetical protein
MDANLLQNEINTLSIVFPLLDLPERIATVRHVMVGRIVFTTSYGIEDQAIADAIFRQDLELRSSHSMPEGSFPRPTRCGPRRTVTTGIAFAPCLPMLLG